MEGSFLLGTVVLSGVRACDDAVFQEGKLASVPPRWCSAPILGTFPLSGLFLLSCEGSSMFTLTLVILYAC